MSDVHSQDTLSLTSVSHVKQVSSDAEFVKEVYWQLVSENVKVNGRTRKLRVFWDRWIPHHFNAHKSSSCYCTGCFLKFNRSSRLVFPSPLCHTFYDHFNIVYPVMLKIPNDICFLFSRECLRIGERWEEVV